MEPADAPRMVGPCPIPELEMGGVPTGVRMAGEAEPWEWEWASESCAWCAWWCAAEEDGREAVSVSDMI